MSSLQHSDARIEFRLPAQRKREIEQAAIVQNRSLTEFATSVLTEHAQKFWRTMPNMSKFSYPTVIVTAFWAMLDANAAPNGALRLAARKHHQRIA